MSPVRELLLAALFRRADQAGYGIADGASFEAFPCLEDAAADYIQRLLDDGFDTPAGEAGQR